MTLALVLFAVAAVVGIAMAIIRFRGKPYPSMAVALAHGLAAAAGLIALIVAVQKPGSSLAMSALVTFLVAAAGGVLAAIMGFVDFYQLRSPSPGLPKIALTHASLALVTLSLFGLAFALRPAADAVPGALPIGLELAGGALLMATGWFGGHLVFKFGVGVDTSSQRVLRE